MKRKFLLPAVIPLLCILLCSCSGQMPKPPELEVPQEYVPTIAQTTAQPVQESIDMYSATLYYSDGFGHLIPIQQKIAWQEGIAKTVLYQLSDSEDTRLQYESLGLYATLPENIEIDLDISGGLACVDLVSEDLPKDAQKQKIMAASVVNTLLDFDSVQSVKLLFNHQDEITYEDGSRIPSVYTQSFSNTDNGVLDEGEESAATLYFCNSTGDFLIPVDRVGPIHDAETALNQLCQTESGSGLISILPENCRILDVRLQEDSALVNFSSEFRQITDNEDALNRACRAIAQTIRPYGNFENLEIYVEGELFEHSSATMALNGDIAANTLP